MEENAEQAHYRVLLREKIREGENLIETTQQFLNLEGIQKLQRKIAQELKFLRKISKCHIKKEHLQCSNLSHFAALVSTLGTLRDVQCVSKTFILDGRKLTIDIICEGGLSWVKVIARNSKSIEQICDGDSSFGVRSVLDQAKDYLECAKENPCCFRTPLITFVFAQGVGNTVGEQLVNLGVQVAIGDRNRKDNIPGGSTSNSHIDDEKKQSGVPKINDTYSCSQKSDSLCLIQDVQSINPDSICNMYMPVCSQVCSSDTVPKQTPCDIHSISQIPRVNLDVSAMLAYVSSVTNGSAHLYEFTVNVLAQQAKWERLRPQKPLLDAFFAGKTLFCCQTAYDSFLEIINTVGGPRERQRASDFMKNVIVLPDASTSSDLDNSNYFYEHAQCDITLKAEGKIRHRSLVIFTFGDRIGAVTVTANDGFIRAAKQKGVNFVVFVHESRALTEQKERLKAINALAIDDL